MIIPTIQPIGQALIPSTDQLMTTHNYAIIDRGRHSWLPDDLPFLPLIPRALAGQPEQLPYLLPLNDLSLSRREELLQEVEYAHSVGNTPLFETLLTTNLDQEYLSRHLIGHLIYQARDNSNYFMRFYDPRVFCQLLWMVSGAQTRLLMGSISSPCITAWTVHIDGRWQTIPPPAIRLKGAGLTVERLDRMGYINLALSEVGPFESLEHRLEASQKTDRLLALGAHHYGISAKTDLVLFAVHGLSKHPEFYRHPLISELLQKVASGRSSYRMGILRLTPDWDKISYELRHLNNINRSINHGKDL